MILALAFIFVLASSCSSDVPESDLIRQAIITQDAIGHAGEDAEVVSEMDEDAETTIEAKPKDEIEVSNLETSSENTLPKPQVIEKLPYKIPVGLENVNDSPLKLANDRALLRFVPKSNMTIDRFYFGFKLKGASCREAGSASYGKGDGGTLDADLVDIDEKSGLPSTVLAHEAINACTRYSQAFAELSSSAIPVLVWVNVRAVLLKGKMYGVIVRNSHSDPSNNFFSFNMPITDTGFAGPHARNEMSEKVDGALLGLDPREHVAYSKDRGRTWNYGSQNGQYLSYMNNNDKAHPATRMPQYGFRIEGGTTLAGQPYYAYNEDCLGCGTAYPKVLGKTLLTKLYAFTGSEVSVGILSLKNLTTGEEASCSPSLGYGKRSCELSQPMELEEGDAYSVHASGTVDVMKMDYAQRVLFPEVGNETSLFASYQVDPKPGTSVKDVPNLWAE